MNYIVGGISFSPGFDNGFESQNSLLLSAIYNIQNTNIINGSGVVIDASVLSASYNFINPEILLSTNVYANISNIVLNIPITNIIGNSSSSTSKLFSTYSLNDITVKGNSVVVPSILTSEYVLNNADIDINGSISLNVDLLSSKYNFYDSIIKGNALNVASILSASYKEHNNSIIQGTGIINNLQPLNLKYYLNDIAVETIVKNYANILSAAYNINNVNIKGDANIESNLLNYKYELLNPIIKTESIISLNILDVKYLIEDANILTVINYRFSADILSASYNFNQSDVIIALPEWINDPQVPSTSYWRDDTECKDNERFLYNSLLTDSYNKFAPIWQYYPTTYNLVTDRVFKEDSNKMVIRSFSASGMIEDIPPEHRSYKLEGLVGNDIVRAWFSQVHFTEASTYSGLTPDVYPSWSPAIGDYLYLTSNGLFYEVINVNDAIELFLNRQHNWELVMRVYRDNKLTVSAGSPTLVNDVILQVCTSAASATTQFNDYLEINEDLNELIKPIEYDEQSGEQSANPFGGW